MNTPYVRAPHQEGSGAAGSHPAPNAALLIDFDNVTMGMRSDLSRELKALLNSDIIKGKVAVQRAYADWRRYPQYIVPLSEASIDLIFAPAYGSSKKNATDIRMAIDGMELVFTRPEIGTFILLTGDSDFSSLVLKLKEYGKYVIGVGIQESSSDILVQNCDEYYSYTNLAGLRKSTDADTEAVDPWLLVERALEQMESRDDVMRSDRLKQVMLEIDSGFDESEYGFSKFSRFLTEASSKGLVELKRMDNGQYEVRTSGGGGGRSGGRSGGKTAAASRSGDGGGSGSATTASSGRGRATRSRGRATRSRSRGDGSPTSSAGRSGDSTGQAARSESPRSGAEAGRDRPSADSGEETLQSAYRKLTDAVERLTDERNVPAVRDSDVKRKILEKDRSFDEAEVGFSKFSLFLQQAHDDGVIRLAQRDSGNYEVGLPDGGAPAAEAAPSGKDAPADEAAKATTGRGQAAPETGAAEAEDQEEEEEEEREAARPEPTVETPAEEPDRAEEAADEPEPRQEAAASGASAPSTSRGLGPRRGERPGRRSKKSDGPPIFEGQVVGTGSSSSSGSSGGASASSDSQGSSGGSRGRTTPGATRGGVGAVTGPGSRGSVTTGTFVDPEELGFPSDHESVVRYLTNSYKGVGEKTAEALLDELGNDLFAALQREPQRVRDVLPANRAEQFLEAWEDDLARRKANR